MKTLPQLQASDATLAELAVQLGVPADAENVAARVGKLLEEERAVKKLAEEFGVPVVDLPRLVVQDLLPLFNKILEPFFTAEIVNSASMVDKILKLLPQVPNRAKLLEVVNASAVRSEEGGPLCPQFGHPNRPGAKFCSDCGVLMDEIEPVLTDSFTISCPECRKDNREGADFCAGCGRSLKQVVRMLRRTQPKTPLPPPLLPAPPITRPVPVPTMKPPVARTATPAVPPPASPAPAQKRSRFFPGFRQS